MRRRTARDTAEMARGKKDNGVALDTHEDNGAFTGQYEERHRHSAKDSLRELPRPGAAVRDALPGCRANTERKMILWKEGRYLF